jgi:hypothetical protein
MRVVVPSMPEGQQVRAFTEDNNVPRAGGNFTIASEQRTIVDWTPTIISPASGATINKSTGTLVVDNKDDIGDTDYGKLGFQFQFSNFNDFSVIFNTVNRNNSSERISIDGSTFTVIVSDMGTAFPNGQTSFRYWRVRAYLDAANGPYSQWSNIRSITVIG